MTGEFVRSSRTRVTLDHAASSMGRVVIETAVFEQMRESESQPQSSQPDQRFVDCGRTTSCWS